MRRYFLRRTRVLCAFFCVLLFRGVVCAEGPANVSVHVLHEDTPVSEATLCVCDAAHLVLDQYPRVHTDDEGKAQLFLKAGESYTLRIESALEKPHFTEPFIPPHNLFVNIAPPLVEDLRLEQELTLMEGAHVQYRIDTDAQRFEDAVFSFDGDVPSFVSLQDNEDGTAYVHVRPLYSDAGRYDFFIVVSDGRDVGNDDSPVQIVHSCSLLVTEGNAPPLIDPIAIPPVDEGEEITYRIQADDPDGEAEVVLAVEDLPSCAIFDGSQIVLQPSYEDSGEYYATVIAYDTVDEGKFTSQRVRIVVNEVNRQPRLFADEHVFVDEGGELDVPITASDPDVDDVVVVDVSGMSGFMKFSDSIISIRPGYDDAGMYALRVRASDTNATQVVEHAIRVTVRNVHRPPVLEGIEDIRIQEGAERVVVVRAYDPDMPDRRIVLHAERLPSFATLAGNQLYIRPDAGDVGSYSIRISANTLFNQELLTEREIRVTVTAAPRFVIRGMVQNSEGMPVGDVTVRMGDRTTYSSSDGTFSFASCMSGEYTVTTRKAGFFFTPEEQVITVVQDDVSVAVTAVKGMVMRIRSPYHGQHVEPVIDVYGTGKDVLPAKVTINGRAATVVRDFSGGSVGYAFSLGDFVVPFGEEQKASVVAVAYDVHGSVIARHRVEVERA